MTSIRYFCINLIDSTERRESMTSQAQAAGIDLQFIPAVDGREALPDTTGHQLKDGSWDWQHFRLNGPQLGCILSHRDALREFLSLLEGSHCVVFEDDAEFPVDLEGKLEELATLRHWDLIKIENRLKKKRGYSLGATSWSAELIAGTKSDIGTTALFYTREGAQKLLNSLTTLTLPFDVHLAHYPCWSLRMLDCYPPIVRQQDVVSNIGHHLREPPKDKPRYRKKTIRRTIGQSLWSIYRQTKALRMACGSKLRKIKPDR